MSSTRNTPGTVDENGVLWKSTSVGKLLEGAPGMDNAWSAIEGACKKYTGQAAVGERAVLEKQVIDGFDKYVMGDYSFISFGEYFKRICDVGSGLAKLSELSPGSRVIIYADTQLLWMLSAFAAWRQGLVVGTIYATLGEEGALFGINQSECKTVMADGKLLKVLGNIADKLCCKRVIVFKEEDVDGASAEKLKKAGIEVTPLADIEKQGAENPQPATPGKSEDTAVLMYTSGTTGNPKGVLLTHGNVACLVAATISPSGALGKFVTPGSRYLCYLPLAHIMELAVEIALLSAGFTLGYGGVGTILPTSVKMLHPNQLGDAQALKPDIFVAAPAVLDKVYNAVSGKFRLAKGLIKWIIDGGLESGKRNFDAGGMGASGCIAPILFKKKVATLLGGNVKMFLTGSAPLGVEVQKFVQTVFNCPVRQGYGLTETTAGTCVTTMEDNSTSTVGPPQECACIRLRDWEEGGYRNADKDNADFGMRRGEVLIGGPMVCSGYLENPKMPDPEITAKNKEEFVTIDGIRYFCTGDIGQFTPNGTLQIIDRKKDLVKLQQGEYVALSKVENAMKTSKYTALPMTYAKSTMSYCIALVCPNEPALRALGLAPEGATMAELCAHEGVIGAVTADIKEACKKAKLAKFEIPEKIILIDELWTPDNEMLTAVNKLKRKQIEQKHQAVITQVYV
jgi:long-chain acyl-CoA synthetase